MNNNFFVGTYTVISKAYCHNQFFDSFKAVVGDARACIVDSTPGMRYARRLLPLAKTMPRCEFVHLDIPDGEHFFHRSVTAGANACRDRFLATDAKYLLFLESDVIPHAALLQAFQNDIDALEQSNVNWGILGGLYYVGWHDFNLKGMQAALHVLSGCTVYRRALIEQKPFRYSAENMAAFPDAWMSVDSGNLGFSGWNDHDIHCKHIKTHQNTQS